MYEDFPFRVIAGTERGASHTLKNIPNQDCLKYERIDNILILAVADGHGSQKCEYSDTGSKIAVEVFCDQIVTALISWISIRTNCSNTSHLSGCRNYPRLSAGHGRTG